MTPIAVVTGASSGIGAATAIALGRHGYRIVVGARRVDRLERVAGEQGVALRLDVTDEESVNEFVAEVEQRFGRIDVLVNNAGGALGLNPIADAIDDEWMGMWKTNVLGLMWMTRACLPLLRKAKHGHIVNIGSIAGFETYRGGAGYTAAKHAEHAVSETLRLELFGKPVRVVEVAPGLVETEEFSLNRLGGDDAAAAAVYAGVPGPLTADDIADCIAWAATRPWNVNIDLLVVRPRAQAAAHKLLRESSE